MSDKVEPMDPNKKNSQIAGPVSDEATVIMNTASDSCVWNDQAYEEGSVVESEGVNYECHMGQWVKKA